MRPLYKYITSQGTFVICMTDEGRFAAVFDNEILVRRDSPQLAAVDVAGGDCDWPNGITPGTLGIPEELSAGAVVRR